jgi:hypothetical protein
VRRSPARGFRAWTALLLLGLAAGTAAAAERSGARVEIYGGAAGGLLLGLVGHLFAVLAVAPGAGPASLKEEARRWRNWAIGLFLRFALLTALTGTFWLAWREHFAAAMLSLAAVWLALHFWEICWLCRRVQNGGARG